MVVIINEGTAASTVAIACCYFCLICHLYNVFFLSISNVTNV